MNESLFHVSKYKIFFGISESWNLERKYYLCRYMEVSDKQDGKVSAVLNWSGGKDSAHALWRVMQEGTYRGRCVAYDGQSLDTEVDHARYSAAVA